MIQYEIYPLSPEAHLFEVKLHISDPNPDGQSLFMPAWIRGSYMIRDFARHIVTLKAECDNQPIPVTKTDKQTWCLAPCSGPVQLTYVVYAWDLSVRGAHLDNTHAYFNGPCVFLAVVGQESALCTLKILAPKQPEYTDWIVATAMPARDIDERGFGIYEAGDYEALLDHPVELGELDLVEFSVYGIPHRFMVSGRHAADLPRLCKDLEKICSQQVDLFGELPVTQYLFLLWVVGEGYGGLEHRNSTSLMCSREDLPTPGVPEITEGYRRLLGLCSHEYFHLWNVKRITPKVFQDTGTLNEVYTRQLWVFEGITSYYDDLALLRSGTIDKNSYFSLLAESITRVMRGAGRKKQTLEESSFEAWTKFYKQDENAPNAIVSYYAKGALLALALDLHIRLKTRHKKSLDAIMRRIWQAYGKTARGLAEGEFERIAAEVSDLDLADFFNRGVRSTEELPLQEILSEFGVEMHLLPAQSSSDNGRVTEDPLQKMDAKPVLGAKTIQQNTEIKLLQIYDEGAAQHAGLSAGDNIVAINGLRLNEKQMEQRITTCTKGESLKVHAFRRDELMEFILIPQAAPADTCVLHLPDKTPEHKLIMQKAWLHLDGNQI